MRIFVEDILPVCSPYPGPCSVIPMDNAHVHMKAPIRAECARVGVIPLFLPPYGYELNAVELAINSARQLLQREMGRNGRLVVANKPIGQLFLEACFADATPEKACNYFASCGVPVTAADREWAANG